MRPLPLRLGASTLLSWALALGAFVSGYWLYGWPGLILAFTMVVFWLLLQFSRALRVMRTAATRPVGLVDSALMAHTRLHRGMKMLRVLRETKSLGRRLAHPSPGAHESWEWQDSGGDSVVVDFAHGRCVGTSLVRGGAAPQPQAQVPHLPT
jgi:hypothetical protein